MYSMLTKEEAMQVVKDDGFKLLDIPIELRNDRDIVLVALDYDSLALQYASDELKNDKNIVLKAVKADGWALEYASAKLRNDKDVVLAAVTQSGLTLLYAGAELQNDMEVILTAVYSHIVALRACKNCTKLNDNAVVFVKENKAFITETAWPLIKRALLEKPDYFLNPEPYMKALTDGMDNSYLILAQYALSKDVIIEPESYPELI